MDKRIFEYQNKDLQILKLEKENRITKYTKAMEDAIATVKDLQDKTDKLGKDAEKQISYFKKIKASLEKAEKELAELESNGARDEASERVKELATSINKSQSNLSVLKNNIEKINKLFEETKIKMKEAKLNHKDAKEKQEEITKDTDAKISVLKNEMLEMEKNIDKELLKEYNECKNDNILPVFVYATADLASCGGCMQKIATNEVNKLKKDKKIVCEHCRRIIIYKE